MRCVNLQGTRIIMLTKKHILLFVIIVDVYSINWFLKEE